MPPSYPGQGSEVPNEDGIVGAWVCLGPLTKNSPAIDAIPTNVTAKMTTNVQAQTNPSTPVGVSAFLNSRGSGSCMLPPILIQFLRMLIA